jgi:hypothetical protein
MSRFMSCIDTSQSTLQSVELTPHRTWAWHAGGILQGRCQGSASQHHCTWARSRGDDGRAGVHVHWHWRVPQCSRERWPRRGAGAGRMRRRARRVVAWMVASLPCPTRSRWVCVRRGRVQIVSMRRCCGAHLHQVCQPELCNQPERHRHDWQALSDWGSHCQPR